MQKVFTHLEMPIPLRGLLEMKSTTDTDGTRIYSTPVGNFPSVTTITGWEKRKFFENWRKDNPAESKRVLRRGNLLHSLIESYINNEEIELMSEDPTVADLFVQIKPELDKIDNIRALEVPLFSRTLELGGRVDCVAEHDGVPCIIDFKGSTKTKRTEYIDNYHMQAAAYCIMWHERTGEVINEYKILVASEDSTTPQVFSGNPIDHVPNLHKAIVKYKRETCTASN